MNSIKMGKERDRGTRLDTAGIVKSGEDQCSVTMEEFYGLNPRILRIECIRVGGGGRFFL